MAARLPTQASSNQGQMSQAQLCEKSLESVAVELAYIITEPPSTQRVDSANKILQRGLGALSNVLCIKWSSIVEQLVENVKLCMFSFDLQDPMTKLYTGSLSTNPVQLYSETSSVCRHGLELLLGLTKVLRGKDGFSLYHAVLMKDYPNSFHFIDILHPDVLLATTGVLDHYILFRLIRSLSISARSTLAHAEAMPVESRAYVSSTQAMAISLEEIILCLIKLYENPVKCVRIDLVHVDLITYLELTPLSKLSSKFLDQLNVFVYRLWQQSPASVQREMIMDITIEVIKAGSNSAQRVVKILMEKNAAEKSIEEITAFMMEIERNAPDPIVDLELLTRLAGTYVTEFQPLTTRCLELLLDLLGRFPTYEKNVCAKRTGQGAQARSKSGPEASQEGNKIYVYSVDKIGKLVRIYNPGRKHLDQTMEKSDETKFYLFRQALHLLEAIICSMGQESRKETREIMPAWTSNFERFLAIAPILINSKPLFICQGTFDCLGAVTGELFSQVPEEPQSTCLSTFLVNGKHESLPIRVKAGRCLGIYLEFEDIAQSDGNFLLEAFSIIERNLDLSDSECDGIYGWVFANFTSVLSTYYQGVIFGDGNSELLLDRLRQLVHKSMKSGRGLHNTYRALGNIFLWLPTLYLSSDHCLAFLKEAVELMTGQIGIGRDYKTRWNACCAVGKLLQNTALVEHKYKVFLPELLTCLSSCMVETTSFKEKVHCLNAVQKLERREYYGDLMQLLLESTLRVIGEPVVEKEENTDRSVELIFRASRCLSHLITLMDKGDFMAMNDLLMDHCDTLCDIFQDLQDDTSVPDPRAIMDSAFSHVIELSKDKTVPKLECLELLCQLLDTTRRV